MVLDTTKRAIEKAFGMSFEETQRLDCVKVRELMERRHGAPCTFAVPLYDSRTGTYVSDPKKICDPDAALNGAIKVRWYERVLDFLNR